MRIASMVNPNYGLPSPTQETIFILHYQGQNIEVLLWMESISMDTKAIPFKAGWKYLAMNPNSIGDANEEELKTIVKEVLQTYKQFGLLSKRTAVTEITFFGFEGGE